jgi:hypothetical protein
MMIISHSWMVFMRHLYEMSTFILISIWSCMRRYVYKTRPTYTAYVWQHLHPLLQTRVAHFETTGNLKHLVHRIDADMIQSLGMQWCPHVLSNGGGGVDHAWQQWATRYRLPLIELSRDTHERKWWPAIVASLRFVRRTFSMRCIILILIILQVLQRCPFLPMGGTDYSMLCHTMTLSSS